jgi:hypothetical protein
LSGVAGKLSPSFQFGALGNLASSIHQFLS